MSSDRLVIRDCAAEYAAGELTGDERRAFEEALAQDPAIEREVAFWRRMRSDLPVLGKPAGCRLPGAGVADVVRFRHERNRQRAQRRLVIATWTGWATAAAALLALAIVAGQGRRPEPLPADAIAFAEDGTALHLPPAAELDASDRDFYLAQNMGLRLPRAVGEADRTAFPTPVRLPPSRERVERPCVGVVVQPVLIDAGGRQRTGLYVVRVSGGGPAANAGIEPGDVLLELAGNNLYTRYCILHAISGRKAGETVMARYWRDRERREVETQVTLGREWE